MQQINRSLVVLLAIALVVLCEGCNREKERREAEQQWNDVRAQTHKENLELEANTSVLKFQLVELEFGAVTAQRWDKCVNDPPKMKDNQESCAKLIAHIKSVQDAKDKAEKAREAKW